MGKPYSDDIRWLVVWKRLVRGKSPREVTEDLDGAVCADTQDTWLRCFAQTGDVGGRTGKAASEESSRRQMTPEMDLLLFQLVIDSPSAMLAQQSWLEIMTFWNVCRYGVVSIAVPSLYSHCFSSTHVPGTTDARH